VTAAGGKSKITIYCLTLLRADPHPTRPARSYSIGPPILLPGHRLSGPPDVPPSGPAGDQPWSAPAEQQQAQRAPSNPASGRRRNQRGVVAGWRETPRYAAQRL